jgi:hypothetical protein
MSLHYKGVPRDSTSRPSTGKVNTVAVHTHLANAVDQLDRLVAEKQRLRNTAAASTRCLQVAEEVAATARIVVDPAAGLLASPRVSQPMVVGTTARSRTLAHDGTSSRSTPASSRPLGRVHGSKGHITEQCRVAQPLHRDQADDVAVHTVDAPHPVTLLDGEEKTPEPEDCASSVACHTATEVSDLCPLPACTMPLPAEPDQVIHLHQHQLPHALRPIVDAKRGYHPIPPITTDQPFDHVAIDLAGPLLTSPRGNHYLFVLADVAAKTRFMQEIFFPGIAEATRTTQDAMKTSFDRTHTPADVSLPVNVPLHASMPLPVDVPLPADVPFPR